MTFAAPAIMFAKLVKWGVLLGGVALVVTRAWRALEKLGPVTATVTIRKPPREVYEQLRNFRRLPSFMTYLTSVEEHGDVSAWTAHVPVIGALTWKARIVEDIPGELVSWETEPGSMINCRGRVTFSQAPGRESTEVRVEMRLGPPGATPRALLARLLASPEVKGEALRVEVADRGVTVTVLQPGATDTLFFENADLLDSKVGQEKKDDPADVARRGFEAMMAGKDSVLGGSFKNRLLGLMNELLPETVKAKQAGKSTKPKH
jgi:hypothetical protein